MTRGHVRVGCSGWEYKAWGEGRFYPASVKTADHLAHYAGVFDTVELNRSFYRLPSEAAVALWRERTPPGFLFSVKASRFLTHMKKLKDPQEPLERMLGVLRGLGPRLGPVLYPLPPRWGVNPGRLEDFLTALPAGLRHVVEFRDSSWYTPAIYRLLERAGVSMCVHDLRGSETPRIAVGPLVYLRLHGTEAKYCGSYPKNALQGWARWLQSNATDQGREGFVSFNNDVDCQAPVDALVLRGMVTRGLRRGGHREQHTPPDAGSNP